MSEIERIRDVTVPAAFYNRLRTGDLNLDRIFGGLDHPGIVPGSITILSSVRGAGKSSFCAQLCHLLGVRDQNCLFVSGEEGKEAFKITAHRLGASEFDVTDNPSLENILSHMGNYQLVVIDSFQMLETSANIRGVAKKEKFMLDSIIARAKETGCAVIIIYQQTKDGKERGSTYGPHIVQTVIYLLKASEHGANFRVINVDKNRLGPAMEYGAIYEKSGYRFLGSLDEALNPHTPERFFLMKKLAHKTASLLISDETRRAISDLRSSPVKTIGKLAWKSLKF